MTAKHTPGPWHIGKGIPTRVYNYEGHLVATVPEGLKWSELPDGELSLYKANAHLIAAAPELLGALKSMLEIAPELPPAECRCHISPPCSDCVNYAGEREIYAEAVAAIAKAAGRS